MGHVGPLPGHKDDRDDEEIDRDIVDEGIVIGIFLYEEEEDV